MTDKCSHIERVSLHPSIKVGGGTVGKCDRDTLPGLTVCFEHATKETLWMMVQQERGKVLEELREWIVDESHEVHPPGQHGYRANDTLEVVAKLDEMKARRGRSEI